VYLYRAVDKLGKILDFMLSKRRNKSAVTKLFVRALEVNSLNRAGFSGGSNSRVGWSIMSKTTNKFFSEVRERAVRLVFDSEGQHGSRWLAIMLIAAKIGCSVHTLNEWVKKAKVDSGQRAAISTEMAERMKVLERETASCARPTRSSARPAHILRWRSSTAG